MVVETTSVAANRTATPIAATNPIETSASNRSTASRQITADKTVRCQASRVRSAGRVGSRAIGYCSPTTMMASRATAASTPVSSGIAGEEGSG